MTQPPLRAPRGLRSTLQLGRARNPRRKAGPSVWVRLGQTLKTIFSWTVAILLVVGLGGGAYVGWQRVVQLPALALQHLTAHGGERTPSEVVLAVAGVRTGTPILSLDLDAIASRVHALPWVHHVTVRRQLPDTLDIEITEHSPTMLVAVGRLYIADADGILFKPFEPTDGLDLPVMTGLSGDPNALGPAAGDAVRAGLALKAGVEAQRIELGELQELHWDEDLGWSVTVWPPSVGSPVRVHLGTEPLNRLQLALNTLKELDGRHEKPEVIWANTAKTPDRVQIQLKVAQPTGNRGSHGTEG